MSDERTPGMAGVVVVLLIGAWCALPFPLAVAIGRAFRAGETADADGVSSRVPAA